jgi:hypothetical protein
MHRRHYYELLKNSAARQHKYKFIRCKFFHSLGIAALSHPDVRTLLCITGSQNTEAFRKTKNGALEKFVYA